MTEECNCEQALELKAALRDLVEMVNLLPHHMLAPFGQYFKNNAELLATVTRVEKEMPCLEWDTCKLTEQQAQWLMEQENEREDTVPLSKDEALRLAGEDADFFALEWSDLCDALTELMEEMGCTNWRAEVTNFGWRKLDGRLGFIAHTGQELLRAVLPDTDCTFKLYKRDGEIAINNAHHDSPTWDEWYSIKPAKEAEDG